MTTGAGVGESLPPGHLHGTRTYMPARPESLPGGSTSKEGREGGLPCPKGRGGGDLPAFLIVSPPFFSLAFLQCHPLSLDSPRALHSVGIVNGQYVQLTNSFSLFSGPFSIISLNQLTGVY